MERSDFLMALADSCRNVRSYMSDRGRTWITNVIATGRDPAKGDGASQVVDIDHIYELLCYFALLRALEPQVHLICRKAPGPTGYRCPYSPGRKDKFAFFRFVDGTEAFDLCNGTEIPFDSETEAPDISLQHVSGPDAPAEPGEVIAIWDAKHHEESVTKADINQMFRWCDCFKPLRVRSGDVLDRLFPTAFQVSGIVSDAQNKPGHRRQLLEAGFSIVLRFLGEATGEGPEPSRADHVEFQSARFSTEDAARQTTN